jgi:hypothetical protein
MYERKGGLRIMIPQPGAMSVDSDAGRVMGAGVVYRSCVSLNLQM